MAKKKKSDHEATGFYVRKSRKPPKPSADGQAFVEMFESMTDLPGQLTKNEAIRDINPSFDDLFQSASPFLFPCFPLGSQVRVAAQIKHELDGKAYTIDWIVERHFDMTGNTEFYEAEMLTCKRKIYEMGAELDEILVLEFERDIKPFADKFDGEFYSPGFADNFIHHIINFADAQFTHPAETSKRRLKPRVEGISFKRYLSCGSSLKRPGREESREYRLALAEYWLGWAEAAHRADFDFDYLATLKPLEMRFYELTKLFRHKDEETSIAAQAGAPLEITYRDFCQLMPLPEMKTAASARTQLAALCRPMIVSGYLRRLKLVKRRHLEFSDCRIVFDFV